MTIRSVPHSNVRTTRDASVTPIGTSLTVPAGGVFGLRMDPLANAAAAGEVPLVSPPGACAVRA